MNTIRWGILGCADIAEYRFIPTLTQDVANGRLHAIASRGKSDRLRRVVDRYRPPKVYFDYNELLADKEVDAVYIPLPNSMHAEWTIRAAEAKKHVLCEKPLACTADDVDRIGEAARRNGVHVMEAFACLHSPLFPTIRELIAKGDIGVPKMVDAFFTYLLTNPASGVMKPELGGGSVYDVGCYNTLSFRQITGREPVAVKAMAEYLPTGVDATVNALFDMGDGVLSSYKSSIATVSNREINVLGDGGYLTYKRTPNAWGKLEIEVTSPKCSKRIPLYVRNTYALEIEQLGRCVAGGETPLVDIEESRKNVAALEMLFGALRG